MNFKNISDHERVWETKSNLKGSGYFVSEYLPLNLKRQHTLVSPIAKAARSMDEFKSNVQLKANVLSIEGSK